MSGAPVADRYARAIFELGIETDQLAPITEQLRRFAQVYAGSAELRAVLDNPIIEQEKRDGVLGDVAARLGLTGNAFNLVRLLASRKKLRLVLEIARRLDRLNDEKAGVVRATVTSARNMPDDFYEQLVSELEAATSRKILLERREDPTLIAGFVTRIGDNTIDGSLRGRLDEIERQLVGQS
ncbi:MAG TPA: ATP synthase F1 subunit delta [Polyangiaceae bacterium]|nr:ATP synthase F1 subunit delta [Polyangiaceae bacterium]